MRSSIVAVCLGVLSLSLGSAEAESILLVFGGTDPLVAGSADDNIRLRLESFGNVVTPVFAPASTTADALGKNVVIISSTVTSADVAAKFRDITAGVLNWEQALQQQSRQDLLTETAERASDGLFTQLTITPTGASHPLAAGLAAGTYTVTTAAGPFSYGNSAGFGTGAVGVAVRGDGTGVEAARFCIYGYATGALRPDGTPSPGPRVQFFLADTTFNQLTPTGLQLFDAAAQYVGAAIPEPSIGGLSALGLMALAAKRRRR
jgi:hypothetical protein